MPSTDTPVILAEEKPAVNVAVYEAVITTRDIAGRMSAGEIVTSHPPLLIAPAYRCELISHPCDEGGGQRRDLSKLLHNYIGGDVSPCANFYTNWLEGVRSESVTNSERTKGFSLVLHGRLTQAGHPKVEHRDRVVQNDCVDELHETTKVAGDRRPRLVGLIHTARTRKELFCDKQYRRVKNYIKALLAERLKTVRG